VNPACFEDPMNASLPYLRSLLIAGLVACAMAPAALAQDPQPLEITSDTTLALPDDGILHYSSFTVRSGADVTFTPNARNTPVQILVTGPILIEGGAYIMLNGTNGSSNAPGVPGPGGFAGANMGSTSDGEGPGGGKGGCPHWTCGEPEQAGHGAFGCDADGRTRSGTPYGNPVLLSLIGGSGGGGSWETGGGGGGGAILLSSDERITLNGQIQALAGCGPSAGCGSGGAVRLRAPIVEGNGHVAIYGPTNNHGRARVDTLNRVNSAITFNPACSATWGSIMATSMPTGTLRIVEVGGQAIADTETGPVFVALNAASPKTVKVRANGFGGIVPVQVVLTPDGTHRLVQVVNADMETADQDGNVVVTATFDDFPVNQGVRVDAWTR
jgi:hypothetical protein